MFLKFQYFSLQVFKFLFFWKFENSENNIINVKGAKVVVVGHSFWECNK
jgi:hypothetical protein